MTTLETATLKRIFDKVQRLRFPNAQDRSEVYPFIAITLERVLANGGTLQDAQDCIDNYTIELLWQISELIEVQ